MTDSIKHEHEHSEDHDYVPPLNTGGKSALSGFIANPYVFATALFASIGGITFGCKYPWFPRQKIEQKTENTDPIWTIFR